MKKPVVASSTEFITWSLGDPEGGQRRNGETVNSQHDEDSSISEHSHLRVPVFIQIPRMFGEVYVLTAVSQQGSHGQQQTDAQHWGSLPYDVRDETLNRPP